VDIGQPWRRVMASRAWLLVVVMLGGCVVWAPSASGLSGPPLRSGPPLPKCKPRRTVACGRVTTPLGSARVLARALEQRGLGVLTPAQLAGRKKARKLNGALAAGLGSARVRARASAAGFGEATSGSTVVSGPRGRNAYSWSFQYSVDDPCPNPGPPDATNGQVRMTGIAVLHISSLERRGPFVIRTDVIARLQSDATLSVSRSAELLALLPKDSPDVMTVRRSQTVIDTRTGNSTERSAGADVNVYTYAADVKTAISQGAFDGMVRQESSEPGPDADGPLTTRRFVEATQDLAIHVGSLMWKAAKRTENYWRTPGQCISLSLKGPSNVAPGGTANISATVSSPHGYTPRQILGTGTGSATWTEGSVIRGESARSLLERLPLPETDPWVEWTAPGQQWTNTTKPGFRLKLPTKAGIASAQILFPAAEAPLYRIDAVTYNANNDATTSGTSNPCDSSGNPVSGNAVDKLDAGAMPFNADADKLDLNDGAYFGSITAPPDRLSATRTVFYHGCDISQPPPPPACVTSVTQPVPMSVGILVQIAKGSESAKVTWQLPAVVVGDGGPGSPCYTPTLTATPNPPETTESASAFLSPGTHKVQVTRPTAFLLNTGDLRQQISGQTIASITFHRVNPDGTPYTG
jgi:hypothetical protein